MNASGDNNNENERRGTNPIPCNYNEHTVPQLFIELDELREHRTSVHHEDGVAAQGASSEFIWFEIARWVTFEEAYNEVGRRFNEPHLSPMRYAELAAFREEAEERLLILASNAVTLHGAMKELVEFACPHWLTVTEQDALLDILLASRYHPELKCLTSDTPLTALPTDKNTAGMSRVFPREPFNKPEALKYTASLGRIPTRRGAATEHHPHTHHGLPHVRTHRFNLHLEDCIEVGTDACCVICGSVDFLTQPIMVLLRLTESIEHSCVCEVDIPVRFLFIFIGPPKTEHFYSKLSRCFAVMMTNKVFRSIMYDVDTVKNFLTATDIFLQDALVMPLSREVNADALAGMVYQIEAYKRALDGPHDVPSSSGAISVKKAKRKSENRRR